MFQRIKNFTSAICAVIVLLAFGTLVTNTVYAAPVNDACAGLTAAGAACGTGNDGFSKIITTVINVLSVIVGAVAVVMIIIGGFRYVVSNGDSNGVQGAKNAILYAIVGLVVVLFAQLIVAFVLDRATAIPAPSPTPAPATTFVKQLA